MASGVTQGFAEPLPAETGVSANSTVAKLGTYSFGSQNIMRRLQGRNHVAAHEYEGFDAGLPQFRLPLAGAAGEMDGRAGGGQGLGGNGGLRVIDRVGRAQAGELGA